MHQISVTIHDYYCFAVVMEFEGLCEFQVEIKCTTNFFVICEYNNFSENSSICKTNIAGKP